MTALTERFIFLNSLAAILAVLFVASSDRPTSAEDRAPSREMLTLPIRVVDVDDKPIAQAVVIPWALRSSQGHGLWRTDGQGESEPPRLITDADGRADIPYPRYSYSAERVRATQVTLSIDHPDFSYIMYEFIDVPLKEQRPHLITLERGVPVEIVPLEEGKPAALDGLYALWSDGRSWLPDFSPSVTDDGALRIPPMPAGAGQVLLVRLDGQQATHFSSIVELELENGKFVRERVELRPAVRIEGRLSENVPRPVTSGRLKALTLPNEGSYQEGTEWFTWAKIAEDGTFIIESWPADEPVQIIVLCDGYIAESGAAPEAVENVRDPDPYYRPQVFLPEELSEPIVVDMTSLVRCEIKTVDETGSPLSSVEVGSNPNVGWWNGGTQVYCTRLVRGEKLLVERDHRASIDDTFSAPFTTTTDANGRGELQLPAGEQSLYAEHADYELQAVRGRRRREIQLVAEEPKKVSLVLQAKGQDYLGDWDKLAGTLFGCTGEECRRLVEIPGFRDKMAKIRVRMEEAEDPTDPLLLTSIYANISEVFDELGDDKEVAIWRRKAAEQAAKISLPETLDPGP